MRDDWCGERSHPNARQTVLLFALNGHELVEPKQPPSRSRGVRIEVKREFGVTIRCLPPVDAPLRLVCPDRRIGTGGLRNPRKQDH